MPKAPKGKSGQLAKITIETQISVEAQETLLRTLKSRFEQNMHRHPGLSWDNIQAKLKTHPKKLISLNAMESTGGEPDIVVFDKKNDEYVFFDCSTESPAGRRSTCFDREGEQAREKQGIHPAGNALDLADAIGIQLLTEDQYRQLQKLGEFDTKTSSWIQTPDSIRKLGGALFCDRRYDTVFLYHNGAQSFYGARGFRGWLKL